MSTPHRAGTPQRVTTLELFFDLVFVFTITQLTAVLANDLTVHGVTQVILMLITILWMYGGYAWLTNSVAPTSSFRRGVLLTGMAGFLGIALAIPAAFAATGWLFGVGYFVVNAAHSVLFIVAGGDGVSRAMKQLGPLNLLSAALVLGGGFAPAGWWRYVAWSAAVAVVLASPYLRPPSGFSISPAHFVERHGLVVIIALGESVVAIGAGAAGVPVDVALVGVAVLGLSLSYLMWWAYFGGDDREAERALEAVEPARRGIVALHAYGWAHFALLLGIVAVAAGIKKVIAHATGHLSLPQALVLAAGLATYLLADAAFRRILRINLARYRVAAAVLALATVPLGLLFGAAELVALIVLLVAVFMVEVRVTGRQDRRTYGVDFAA